MKRHFCCKDAKSITKSNNHFNQHSRKDLFKLNVVQQPQKNWVRLTIRRDKKLNSTNGCQQCVLKIESFL